MERCERRCKLRFYSRQVLTHSTYATELNAYKKNGISIKENPLLEETYITYFVDATEAAPLMRLAPTNLSPQ